MKNYKHISCVVLNYKKYDETLACVDSIRNQQYQNYSIVIVENGSKNESWKILNEKYAKSEDVFLIKSDDNLGFAKGNNLGIDYAHDILKADIIFVVNSDVVLLPNLFLNINNVSDCKYGVISPMVFTADGTTLQNPAVNTDNIHLFIDYLVRHLYIGRFLQLPIIGWMYSLYQCRKKNVCNSAQTKEKKRYFLQGCSYFLMPQFFKYYRHLYPNTFLYWEEVNLLVMLDKVGLEAGLLNDSYVIHKEKSSTKELFKKNFDKWVLKCSMDSYKKSKQMFEEDYHTIKNKYFV